MNGSQTHHVIDSSYLRNVAIKCALIFIAGLVATTFIFYLMMRQPIGPTYGEGFRMLAQLEQDIFYKSLIIYGSTVLVTMLCIVLITMLYSHRVAGPIFRLKLFARQISDGDLSRGVTLRQTDAIHPLAHEMNLMIGQFHQTVTKVHHEIDKIEQRLDQVDSEENTAEGAAEIKDRADKISILLSEYRL